ncbi:MAG: UDP-N-acetylmuramate dehydrogenase [Clostridia bacterium]|nr:UDP-N-acetylmuramate dehydrogenase [Clostridia bacterium]
MDYITAIEKLGAANIRFSENASLSQYTTFKIGGPARLAVFPKTSEEAIVAFDILRECGIRIVVLGNGSNVLIDDAGIDGAVVIFSDMRYHNFSGRLSVDAGVPLTYLASEAAKFCFSGLEFAYGIPGTVGGAIYMNAGAFGTEIGSIVVSTRYYDLDTGECGYYYYDDHEFSYRHSVYMGTNKVILSASLRMAVGKLGGCDEKMAEYMSTRKEKQPLDLPSAGSVFKRGKDFITAQVIDEAGLKGRRVGGAEVSEKHAGFIVNRGGATAKDVLELIEIVKGEVREKFGYELECEVRYIK